MKVLERRHAKTKQQLISLYINQYSEKALRKYINDIIETYRPNTNNRCKNVSTQEFLTFVELYGLPDGYVLSPSLQNELENRKLKV